MLYVRDGRKGRSKGHLKSDFDVVFENEPKGRRPNGIP